MKDKVKVKAMESMDQCLQPALQLRQEQQLYRFRQMLESSQQVRVKQGKRTLLNFCSNDYLGLAAHPEVKQAAQDAIKKYGMGSGSSHLICGHHLQHHLLEEELAAFTNRDRALVFSTGFMANLGTITALVDKQDAVFEDKLNHASLLDGGLASGAKFRRFPHLNYKRLDQLLNESNTRRKLVVSDSVFSMDGDQSGANTLVEICEKHQAWLMLDDAHGFGVLGDSGAGYAEQEQLSQSQLPILMATFGKALGTFGAFVAGSEILIETLVQQARSYIYTTGLPPAIACATRESLRLIIAEPERRQKLNKLIRYFKDQAKHFALPLMLSDTPIQPILVGDAVKSMHMANSLKEKGIWVTAIRPPTVAKGSSRLRVTLSAEHEFSDIDQLMQLLTEEFKA